MTNADIFIYKLNLSLLQLQMHKQMHKGFDRYVINGD